MRSRMQHQCGAAGAGVGPCPPQWLEGVAGSKQTPKYCTALPSVWGWGQPTGLSPQCPVSERYVSAPR